MKIQSKKITIYFFFICFSCIFLEPVYCSSVSESDSLELVDFYNLTNGDNWTNTIQGDDYTYFAIELETTISGIRWLTGPVSEWFGIHLNSITCEISRITLIENNLTGIIHDLNLPNLTELNLDDNNLTGGMPDFCCLSGLRKLRIARNPDLKGTIPSFSNLVIIDKIDIEGDGFTGSVPTFNLPELFGIDISDNSLGGNLDDFNNSSLPKLNWFDFKNNKITGNVPSFNNLDSLVEFSLQNNLLDGIISEMNLSKLDHIIIYNNNLNEPLPSFAGLSNLKCLRIDSNNFTFQSLESLLPNLNTVPGAQYGCTGFEYASQDPVPIIYDKLTQTLSIEVGGTLLNNQYYWFKDGIALPDMPIIGDSTFSASLSGIYHCEVTNTIVTNSDIPEQNLILKSNPIGKFSIMT